MHPRIPLRGAVLLFAAAGLLPGQSPQPGAAVADFEFVDRLFLPRSLSELLRGRAAVVVFTTTTACPLADRILPRVQRLAETYRSQGVGFLGLNVGRGDSVVDACDQALALGVGFPFGKDFDGDALRALGVDRTCTAVVIDRDQRLRYRGRVDGAFRFAGPSPDPGRADLARALDDVLAGRAVAVPQTAVEGCAVALAPPAVPEREVTYHRDVARIVQRRCQPCHRPGGEAPFALLDYDDCADRGAMLAEVVRQGRMPPWYASGEHGAFRNDRRLPAAERRVLVDWFAGGLREGDPAAAPAPSPLPDDTWRIGEPDLDLVVPVPIRVPAEGYIPYRYYVLPYRFHRDTWVTAIEIRPTNKRVLHHANLAYVQDGLRYRQDGFLTGQVPGGRPMQTDAGVAVKIPAGSVLALQCHYVTTGKPEVDRLHVGLRFARATVQQQLRPLIVGSFDFEIPPRAGHHPVQRTKRLRHDAEVVGLFAHMHLRGKDMTFRALLPDGAERTLLRIPTYNFDWQDAYVLERGALQLPRGTRVEVSAHFDNSAWNPFNPDPDAAVRFGLQTYHEMMYGFLFYTAAGEQLGLTIDPATGWVLE